MNKKILIKFNLFFSRKIHINILKTNNNNKFNGIKYRAVLFVGHVGPSPHHSKNCNKKTTHKPTRPIKKPRMDTTDTMVAITLKFSVLKLDSIYQ